MLWLLPEPKNVAKPYRNHANLCHPAGFQRQIILIESESDAVRDCGKNCVYVVATITMRRKVPAAFPTYPFGMDRRFS